MSASTILPAPSSFIHPKDILLTAEVEADATAIADGLVLKPVTESGLQVSDPEQPIRTQKFVQRLLTTEQYVCNEKKIFLKKLFE